MLIVPKSSFIESCGQDFLFLVSSSINLSRFCSFAGTTMVSMRRATSGSSKDWDHEILHPVGVGLNSIVSRESGCEVWRMTILFGDEFENALVCRIAAGRRMHRVDPSPAGLKFKCVKCISKARRSRTNEPAVGRC